MRPRKPKRSVWIFVDGEVPEVHSNRERITELIERARQRANGRHWVVRLPGTGRAEE